MRYQWVLVACVIFFVACQNKVGQQTLPATVKDGGGGGGSSAFCRDSDGGDNTTLFGYVYYRNVNGTFNVSDHCLMADRLIEGTCQGSNAVFRERNCGQVLRCVDGRCYTNNTNQTRLACVNQTCRLVQGWEPNGCSDNSDCAD